MDLVPIADTDQIEATRGCHRAALGPVARRERPFQVVGAPLALTHELEAADHRTHLVVQERAGGRVDPDFVAFACDVEAIERAQWRVRLAPGGTESREIVAADNPLCRLLHRRGFERDRQPPDAVLVEGGWRAAHEDPVEVVPRRRAEACVEVCWRDLARSSTTMGAGFRWKLSASRTRIVSHARTRSKCATCPSAWTPASVRPAP